MDEADKDALMIDELALERELEYLKDVMPNYADYSLPIYLSREGV